MPFLPLPSPSPLPDPEAREFILTADFGEPENTPLAGFARDQDAAKDKRVTGPIAYAIDDKPTTAWGINAGPGRRNVPRNAVFVLEKPVELKADKSGEITFGINLYFHAVHEICREAEQLPDLLRVPSRQPIFRLHIGPYELACHRVGLSERESIWSSFPKNEGAAALMVEEQLWLPGVDLGIEHARKLILAHLGNAARSRNHARAYFRAVVETIDTGLGVLVDLKGNLCTISDLVAVVLKIILQAGVLVKFKELLHTAHHGF